MKEYMQNANVQPYKVEKEVVVIGDTLALTWVKVFVRTRGKGGIKGSDFPLPHLSPKFLNTCFLRINGSSKIVTHL